MVLLPILIQEITPNQIITNHPQDKDQDINTSNPQPDLEEALVLWTIARMKIGTKALVNLETIWAIMEQDMISITNHLQAAGQSHLIHKIPEQAANMTNMKSPNINHKKERLLEDP